jgi:hypothetical protein
MTLFTGYSKTNVSLLLFACSAYYSTLKTQAVKSYQTIECHTSNTNVIVSSTLREVFIKQTYPSYLNCPKGIESYWRPNWWVQISRYSFCDSKVWTHLVCTCLQKTYSTSPATRQHTCESVTSGCCLHLPYSPHSNVAEQWPMVPTISMEGFVQNWGYQPWLACISMHYVVIHAGRITWVTFFFNLSLPLWSIGLIYQFLDHFTDGRIPWTGDELVARPLPKHRTTQTQNKRTQLPNIHALCGIRTQDTGFQASEDSICLTTARLPWPAEWPQHHIIIYSTCIMCSNVLLNPPSGLHRPTMYTFSFIINSRCHFFLNFDCLFITMIWIVHASVSHIFWLYNPSGYKKTLNTKTVLYSF